MNEIRPESDFQTWLTLFMNCIDNADELPYYVEDFVKIVKTLREDLNLMKKYNILADKFLPFIHNNILMKILSNKSINTDSKKVYFEILWQFVQIIRVEFDYHYSAIPKIITSIFNSENAIYKANPKLYPTLQQKMIDNTDFHYIMSKVNTYDLQTLVALSNFAFEFFYKYKSNQHSDMALQILNRLYEIMKTQSRVNIKDSLSTIIDKFISLMKENKLFLIEPINLLYKIFTYELASDNIIHHNSGIQLFFKVLTIPIGKEGHQKLINDNKSMEYLFKIPFRAEYIQNLKVLYSKLSVCGYLRDYIDEFWKLSNEDFFLDLLFVVYHFSSVDDLNLHLVNFLKLKKDEKWVETATKIINENKNRQNAIDLILNGLQNDEKKFPDFVKIFKSKLLAEKASEEDFLNTVDTIIQYKKINISTCHFLSVLLSKYNILDKKKCSELELIVFEFFCHMKTEDDTVLDCLILFVTKQMMPVSSELVYGLISIASQFDSMKMFAKIMDFVKNVPFKTVLIVLMMDSIPVSKSLSLFIENVIYKPNLDRTEYLIGMEMSCSYICRSRELFGFNFLHYLSMNSKDQDFLLAAVVCFQKYILEDDCLTIFILFLLDYMADIPFQKTLVPMALYDNLNSIEVTVMSDLDKKQSFYYIFVKYTYIRNVFVSAVDYFGYDTTNYSIFLNGKICDLDLPLSELKKSSLVFTIQKVTNNFNVIPRTIDLSRMVIQVNIYEFLVQNLSTKNQYLLLQNLPVSEKHVTTLLACQDLSEIFPLDRPYLLLYNFTILTSDLVKLSDFLEKSIPKFIVDNLNNFSDDLMIDKCLRVLPTYLPLLDQKELFEKLMKLPMKFSKLLTKIIPVMDESKINIKSLLYSLAMNDSDDAKFFEQILSSFPIPVTFYSEISSKINKVPNDRFFSSLLTHIVVPTIDLMDLFDTVLYNDFYSFSSLEFVSKFLEQKFITKKDKIKVTEYLSRTFFNFSKTLGDEIDSSLFISFWNIVLQVCDDLKDVLYKTVNLIMKDFGIEGEKVVLRKPGLKCGLINNGHNCFMNATLQCLCCCCQFLSLMLDNVFSEGINVLLQNIVEKMTFSNELYLETKSFCSIWDQTNYLKSNLPQDAAEFLSEMFNYLEIDVGEKNFEKYFTTKIDVKIKTDDNKILSESTEKMIMIPVNLNSDIFTSLKELYKPQRIKYNYNGKTVDAVLTKTYESLPDIFIVQLKRFEYDHKTGKRIKLNDKVEIKKQFSFGDKTYNLQAVALHHGSIDNGHYTAAVRNVKNYYYCNDYKVERVNDFEIKGEPYLLFYTCYEEDYTYLVQIKKRNMLRNLDLNISRVLLTKNFYKIMRYYAKKPEIEYNIVALKYFFNLSCHYLPSYNIELGNLLMESLLTKSELRLSMMQEFSSLDFVNSLIACPTKEIRNSTATLLTVFFSDLHLIDDVQLFVSATYKNFEIYTNNLEEITSVLNSLLAYDDVKEKIIQWKVNQYIEKAVLVTTGPANNMIKFLTVVHPTQSFLSQLSPILQTLVSNGTKQEYLRELIDECAKSREKIVKE
ncbi:Clan CA, family C19, ubiquitin hydrolase-like cysteine peptidase [Trichomonas vaginalis G3]|uniref:Clan CA, family C19, ubiquitin hydrolase-like cysteine peptidase n=1 Tax=Trichomonas vaginalis (strain ATCC PRA-98 / G3) TaxID=412133 RepID=A2DH40_TRIV3|nr:ubiquitinyl hydrolase protein [Trichomonas vaginalis G3]EAY20350.1 Clan CA, family C19, ubiquitin hydrolase-like cysteine peptidase [Trichomonas vaginalis G3]KAI5530659.1 ubiquitinyl hydrolase protein [Trichomonas vaginalis G3]|eukprot:XP_001581336.1 Clan CA, family C19, ubiquitin hydrolase-like cysteine peptidase [Trichomonas vaginalis G3]